MFSSLVYYQSAIVKPERKIVVLNSREGCSFVLTKNEALWTIETSNKKKKDNTIIPSLIHLCNNLGLPNYHIPSDSIQQLQSLQICLSTPSERLLIKVDIKKKGKRNRKWERKCESLDPFWCTHFAFRLKMVLEHNFQKVIKQNIHRFFPLVMGC